MPASPNQPSEPTASIQERYEKAQQRYSPLRAVIDRPDVPAKGKLFAALAGTSTFGSVVLGIRNAPLEAHASVIICTLFLALFINQIPAAVPPQRKAKRARWPGAPKPRPRYRNKGQF